MEETHRDVSQRAQGNERALDVETTARAYRYLLRLRDVDNKLMWTRSNIILLIQGGFLAILASKFDVFFENYVFLAAISVFGLVTALLWRRITIGGSFWVDFWEGKLSSIEPQVTGDINLFRNHPSREQDREKRREFRRRGYRSIRKTLITVTSFTIVLWTVLLLYAIISAWLQCEDGIANNGLHLTQY